MRTLVEFISESQNVMIEESLIFENILDNDEMTLEECYDAIFDAMFSVNEGFFSNLGKKLANLGSKAEAAGENLDKKLKAASEAAKTAIENAKKKAGEAWDKVKDTYTSVVLAVDGAIQASKKSMEDICKQVGLKFSEFEAKCAQIYSNAIAASKETAEEIGSWISDKTKGAQRFAAMNTLLAGAMLAKASGIDASLALEVLTAAGFK